MGIKRHALNILINFIILIVVFACAIVGSSVVLSQPETELHEETAVPPPVEPLVQLPTASVSGQKPELTPKPDPELDLDTEPETDTEPAAEYFTIAMMGDCSLASEHNAKGGAYAYEIIVGDDYTYPFSIVKPLYDDADFVIVNLECAICEYNVPQNKAFRLRAPPEYVNILIEGGVDFVALGNNHTMDYGLKGYEETQEILSENSIGFAPDGKWNLFTTSSGLCIGVYSKNTANEPDMVRAIAEMKEAGVELIIVALHWGDEGSYRAADRQIQLGRAAIDAGAHIVMGTHPHTLQEMVEYNGGYIYFSLGNWTFGGHTNPRDKDSIIAKVYVLRDVDGGISVVDYENIPCSVSGSNMFNDYRPVPYEVGSEEYERTISKLNGSFAGPNLDVSYDELNPVE